jgi:putative multiple sugar transport system substrate-binding protein
MPTKSSGRWESDAQIIVGSLAGLGRRTDLGFAQDDIPIQVAQIDRMVTREAKVLIVAAIDAQTLTDILHKAGDAGVTILAYQTFVEGSPDVDYYVAFDNFKVGVLQARSIETGLDLKSGDGPFNVELFAGSPDDVDAELRFKGAMSILQPYLDSGKLVVKSGQTKFAQIGTLHSDAAAAKDRMDAILHSDFTSERIDAVLSPTDAISQGLIASLKSDGYYTAAKPGPIVTGHGADVASIKSILAGEQTATVFEDSRLLAAQAATMADQILAGATVDTNDAETYDIGGRIVPSFLLEPVSLDRSNVQKQLVDTGYYKPSDLR